ncbi:hypothetical protein C8J57DRAFT_1471924 [Mycena rebaudengoi]|nr:hypothetical protein C8J57DRAFT_1471924 [Mycena rebaudengoi]
METKTDQASGRELRTRLVQIEDEIAALTSKLRLLYETRKDILEDLKTVRYPILSLPPEITAEIFKYYVALHLTSDSHFRVPLSRGPLLLASICRAWRTIVLSLHALWARFRMISSKTPHLSDATISNMESFLQYWLPRAGSSPLDFYIPPGGCRRIDRILRFLSTKSLQWRSVGFTLLPPFSFPNDEIRGRVPCLKRLAVAIPRSASPVPITAFLDAPQLREVIFDGAAHLWMALPWTQLIKLELKYPCLQSESLSILQRTPNLEVLVVHVAPMNGWDITSPHEHPPVQLLNLHTLSFLGYDPDGHLLDYLTLPSLKTISLASLGPGVRRLASLVKRSAVSLELMHLNDLLLKHAIACLEAAPSLREVSISFSETVLDRNDFSALCRHLAIDKTLLPALRSLTIHDYTHTASLTSLLEVLWTRRNPEDDTVVKLEFFRLVFEGSNQSLEVANLIGDLRFLIEGGLTVEIDSAPEWPSDNINADMVAQLSIS